MSAALRQRNTWLGLFVALVSGAGFEATGAVAGPLLVKLGCDVAAVGWWRSAWVAALVVGAWLGGVSSDRWGHRRCVAAYLVLLAAVIAATAVMLTGEPGPVRVALALTGVYVGIGLFLATSYALFMDLTDPRIGGTQFSAFMGATNGCEAWSGAAVGRLIALLGYPVALMVMVLASLASLPVLALLRDKPPTDEG